MWLTMILPKIYAQEVQRKTIDLSLSENPLGCSSLVAKIMKNISINDVNLYPDTSKLVQKIVEKFKIRESQVVLGCGSEQLIKLISQTFLQKNYAALVQRGSFSLFTKECLLAGAKIKFFQPTKTTKIGRAKIIFICNPNNPTGEVLNPVIIKNIVKKASKSIVVVDEANGEFIKDSFIIKAVKSKNCLVLRTFSKVFGLAGIRVGFVIGNDDLIKLLRINQQQFPVSTIACKLALPALDDKVFIQKTIKFTKEERLFLISELKKRRLQTSNSVTNNIFVKTPFANKLISELNSRGVSVIPAAYFPGMKKPGFRICIKDKRTNRLFLTKLDEVLSCMNSKKLLPSRKEMI